MVAGEDGGSVVVTEGRVGTSVVADTVRFRGCRVVVVVVACVAGAVQRWAGSHPPVRHRLSS